MNNNKKIWLIIFAIFLLIIVGLLLFFILRPKEKVMISFITNIEERLDSIELNKGDSISLPLLKKENKEFLGWYIGDVRIDDNYKFEKSTIVNAKWKNLEYVISFDTDGGNNIDSITVDCGLIKLPSTPTKSGYTFVEWHDGFDNKVDNNSKLKCENQTLKAIWKKNGKTYTVSFNSDGGSIISDQVVNEGAKAKKPTDPIKSDYTFVEWQLDGKKYDFDNKITKNITLKAVWKISEGAAVKTYTVSFESDGGSSVASQTVKAGGKVIKPANPTKSGYTFVEWQLNNKTYDFNTAVNNNITLKAVWKSSENPTVKTYTVSFNSDGGSSIASQKVKAGGKVTKPATPIKSGYTFVEWQLNNKTYDFNTAVNNNITLKAVWKSSESPTVKTYTVSFESNGGSSVASQKVKAGGKISKPANPTRKGYTFVEWQLNNKTYNFDTAVNTNMTLTALWKGTGEKTFNVIFFENSSILERNLKQILVQTVNSGDKAIKPTDPAKTGMIFDGWVTSDGKKYNFDNPVTKDIVLLTSWKNEVYYNVVFKYMENVCISGQNICVDVDKIYKTVNVKRGDTVSMPANPTKKGYTFVEWQLNGKKYDFNTPVTSNITLNALWSK